MAPIAAGILAKVVRCVEAENTAVAQKLSKLAIFHLFSRDFFFLSFPVFERYDTEFKKPEKTPIFMPLLTKIP